MSRQLDLSDAKRTDAELIEHMLRHPILIDRPFVEAPLGTRLCRPGDKVLAVLPGSTG